jgi:hypothetical protein
MYSVAALAAVANIPTTRTVPRSLIMQLLLKKNLQVFAPNHRGWENLRSFYTQRVSMKLPERVLGSGALDF